MGYESLCDRSRIESLHPETRITICGGNHAYYGSGLDEQTISACLDSGKHADRVEAERVLGRTLGASGTPAFLINGQLLIGAYPFEVFQQTLDAALAAPRRGAPSRTK